ncbi:hypothetical protein LSTR_LSTR002107 [Laodelphax striatellus]|uniref:Uncharacterized protein n=1 Tax=Laodelphax striatellus TaxID=195883 RepID=A0A482XSX8_LAOST|nr:hypothetical protein LSTR_LSTR002107 [Laodelphax striatellus]
MTYVARPTRGAVPAKEIQKDLISVLPCQTNTIRGRKACGPRDLRRILFFATHPMTEGTVPHYPIIARWLKTCHLHLHCMAVLLLKRPTKTEDTLIAKTSHDDVVLRKDCVRVCYNDNNHKRPNPYNLTLWHSTTYPIMHDGENMYIYICTAWRAAIKRPTKTEDTLIAKLA